MTWHADADVLARYRDGELSNVGCSSVEAHLVTCADCREAVARLSPVVDLDDAWDGIVATLAVPEPSWLERVLSRVGVSEPLAHLVGVTPSLQSSWLAGVVITLVLSVLFSHLDQSDAGALFMLIAPLIPVAGVAVAFGPGVDPTYELLVAAPIRAFDVLMARAAAVLSTTLPIAGVASLALPMAGWEVVAWLMPTLTLTALTLALASWVVPWKGAAGLCGFWVALIAVYGLGLRPDPTVIEALAGPAGQLLLVVVFVAASALVLVRRETFELEVVR